MNICFNNKCHSLLEDWYSCVSKELTQCFDGSLQSLDQVLYGQLPPFKP